MKDLQPHKWCALAKVHVYVRVKHWVGWLRKGNIDWYNKDLDCNKLYEDMRPMELYACKPIWYLLFACITHLDNDCDRIIVAEAHSQNDGPTWEKTKRYYIESLRSWKVFISIITTLKGINPMGCRWVFVRKRDKFWKCFPIQSTASCWDFTQCPSIDYEEVYSNVMDLITFKYLISIAVDKKLETRLMDVITAYLYENLDIDIYI